MSEPKFKIILLGDVSVGKTSIATRHAKGTFDFKMISTVGVDHVISTMTVQDRPVKLLLWDTAGQEEFVSLVPMYARGTQVCIIVASIVDLVSLEHIPGWEDRLRESGEDPAIIVAINKTDLLDGAPTTIEKIRDEFGDRYPRLFFVSARSGDSIHELFYEAALQALRKGSGEAEPPKVYLEQEEVQGCGC
jgi:small GTP-binding protein